MMKPASPVIFARDKGRHSRKSNNKQIIGIQ